MRATPPSLLVAMLLTGLALGCVVQPAPTPAQPPPPAGPAMPPPGSPPPVVVTPPGGNHDGAACGVAADCASGTCEGLGCGTGGGVCAANARACTNDLREYCGCDGVTFRGSGSCPGKRYAATGACAAATPTLAADGAACLQASDCASGTCEGVGCGASAPGTCAPRARPCTRDLRAYCGCDGATFRTSGSCPGQRYAHAGAC